MTDCTKCRHFIYCDPYKMLLYKGLTSANCKEYKKLKSDNGDKNE
jgi:hypothetical protein